MDEEQQKACAERLSRLFALITMKLEDAAEIAADCQGHRPRDELMQGDERLETLLSVAETIVAAALNAGRIPGQ